MALARTLLLSRRFHSLLHPQNVAFISHILIHSNPHRPFASSSQTLADSDQIHALKSLHSLFQEAPVRRIHPKKEKVKGKSKQGEALDLSENTEDKESKVGSFKNVNKKKKKKKKPQKKSREIAESKVNFVEDEVQGKTKQGKAVSLSEGTEHEKCEVQGEEGKKKKVGKKLKKPKKWKVKFIEEEEEEEVVVKVEQQEKPEPKRLYDIFNRGEKPNEANPRRLSPVIAAIETHEEVKQREPADLKKLSVDMETFLSYLYKEGYFRDANFIRGKEFDLSWFDSENARNYTLCAAQKFGKDKQDISKWLSGSDLKQVAMFGCPSATKAKVFPSKRLRHYFKIPENTVCGECVLRDSCKFANQAVWKTGNNLDLPLTMKIICSYAMSIVHPQLVVPEKVNNSVNRLLKEVLKLSQTL